MSKTIAKAWVSRARQLLEGKEDTAAYGFLVRWDMSTALADGDLDRALEIGEQLMEIATRLGHHDLVALALQDKGRVLMAQGHVTAGLELIDEAMLAAVAGELTPMTTGRSYCNMLDACATVADYERGGRVERRCRIVVRHALRLGLSRHLSHV